MEGMMIPSVCFCPIYVSFDMPEIGNISFGSGVITVGTVRPGRSGGQ
jgi:hypothetical protein